MRWWSLVIVLVAAVGSSVAQGLGTRQVKVSIEFRQSGTEDRDALQGGLVIVERGGTAARAGLGADSRTTKVVRSSGIFTLVQDGGDARLRVAARVPVADVRFYRDYATGAGYVVRDVAFQDVGTSLKVHAEVLSGNRIRLRLVPSVSYFSADGSGTIDFTDAATDLVVENGESVTIGGGTTQTEEITRRILGYGARRVQGESSILLTALLQ